MSDNSVFRVTVGVDGSASSLEAVRWAAAEATARAGTLRIVHAWLWPMMPVPLGPAPGVAEGGFTAEAHRVLREASAVASKAGPDLEVRSALVTGAAQVVLAHESTTADLLVLGDRGLGGFTGMLMGSVAVAMAHHASCPVVIVRGHADRSGPIVVGVDGSASDEPALTTAFQRAERDDAPVLAIHAWLAPSGILPAPAWSGLSSELEEAAGQLLDDALATFVRDHPAVSVERRLVCGSPTGALVAASQHARLVVVASHGAGALLGLVGGSVCHGVIYHAHCPVEVVSIPRVTTGDRAEARRLTNA